MTHVQMRQLLVEQSGMRGLVTNADSADYSNKSGLLTNATYYLNAGLRWLNRRWTLNGVHHRHVVTIVQGQHLFFVPRSDFITRIDVENASGERTLLKAKTLAYLRNFYPEPFSGIDEGEPIYWAPNTAEGASTELIPDPAFAADPLDGVSGWAVLSGESAPDAAEYNAATDSLDWAVGEIAYIKTNDTIRIDTDTNQYVITYALTADFGQVVKILFDDEDSGESYVIDNPLLVGPTGGERVSFSLSSVRRDSDSAVMALPAGNYRLYFGQQDVTALPYNISYFSIATLGGNDGDTSHVIMPPADGTYTLTVFGDFRTADLDEDADENWWTINHPELVCRAARINIGVDAFRSASELEFFTAAVETELERMVANDRHAEFSAMTPTDFCTNG